MRADTRPRPACCALLGTALAVLPLASADAAQWRITPRVSVEETWSDNVGLDASGNGQDDFVTQVVPGVGLTGSGGRLDVFFDYQASLSHHARGSGSSGIDHRLQSNATAEISKGLLFLDVDGVVGQRNTDSQGVQSTDVVSVNDNRSRFASFGASPYLRFRFGDTARSEVRYRMDRVNNQGSVNSTLQSMSLSVTSGEAFRALPWSFNAQSSDEDSSTGSSSTFRSFDGSLGYVFSRRYSVRFNAGYESNDIQSLRGDTSALTWRVNGIWTPTPRTSFDLGYGSRFFGETITLSFSHRMRKAVFTASVSEDVTTSAREQAREQLFPLEDAFGDAIENPGQQRVDIPTNSTTISDDVLVSRSVNAGVSLRGRRTTSSISLFHNERSSESGRTADETVFGLSASASRRLSRRANVSAAGSWQRNDGGGTGAEDTLISVTLTGSYRINTDVFASMSYGHTRNSASGGAATGAGAAGDYTENRVSARLNVSF